MEAKSYRLAIKYDRQLHSRSDVSALHAAPARLATERIARASTDDAGIAAAGEAGTHCSRGDVIPGCAAIAAQLQNSPVKGQLKVIGVPEDQACWRASRRQRHGWRAQGISG